MPAREDDSRAAIKALKGELLGHGGGRLQSAAHVQDPDVIVESQASQREQQTCVKRDNVAPLINPKLGAVFTWRSSYL